MEYQRNGAKALNKLEDFRDDFIFDYKDTGKLLLLYNDEQMEYELQDFEENKEIIKDRYGCCLIPTTYELGKSQEYFDLLTDESSTRARYNEG